MMKSILCSPLLRGLAMLLLSCIAASLPSAAISTAQQLPGLPLRTLVTTLEAHSLTIEEAKRGYPVILKAVVTYYDASIDPRRPSLLIHDATGGIFVALSTIPTFPIKVGMLIEVKGVSDVGDFAPVIRKARLRVLGMSRLPPHPPRVSMSQLLAGRYDGQWIEVEGMIHDVQHLSNSVHLKIAMSDGMIGASAAPEAGVDYSRLVGSRVKVHANAIPVFNRKLQMIGVRLLFPGSAGIKIESVSGKDPFEAPVTPISHLLRYSPNLAFTHRVHVRGTVTLDWPGRSLCLQDGADGLCAQIVDDLPVTLGETVDVVGFPEGGAMTSILTDAIVRHSEPGAALTPTLISAAQALHGDYDAALISVEGKLIGEDHSAKDRTLLLSSGGLIFPVVLPGTSPDAREQVWQAGSTVRVTGICSVEVDTVEAHPNFLVPKAFRILLRSQQDVMILHRASWWTADHLLRVLAFVFVATLSVLCWSVVLRHRVSVQAALIQRHNATLRELSFQDGLTGVANRRKFDETLEREFVEAARTSKPISLLMIDIDYFKALNDANGHQFGDECLVRVAQALARANLRTSDLLARYGGEEFGVIMPSCDDQGAVAAGERMRAAVWDLSIAHPGSPLDRRLSISVGTTTMIPDKRATVASLIARADHALYQSKFDGRNRTTRSNLSLEVLSFATSTV